MATNVVFNVFTGTFDYVNNTDSIIDDILIELDNVISDSNGIIYGDIAMLADNAGNLLEGTV
jgi:hypothetical protein